MFEGTGSREKNPNSCKLHLSQVQSCSSHTLRGSKSENALWLCGGGAQTPPPRSCLHRSAPWRQGQGVDEAWPPAHTMDLPLAQGTCLYLSISWEEGWISVVQTEKRPFCLRTAPRHTLAVSGSSISQSLNLSFQCLPFLLC